MRYQKPTVIQVGPAIHAIEQASTVKGNVDVPDSMFHPTDSAYQADE